jgi:3-methyl-2-oxobutanoate hydroxymethyltransferase
VLVLHDVLGLNPDRAPSFAKRYADGAALMRQALQQYAGEVRSGIFPAAESATAKQP